MVGLTISHIGRNVKDQASTYVEKGAIPPIGPSERRGTIAALSGLFRSSVGNSGATGIQGFLSTSNASGSNQLKPVENAPTLSTVPAPTTNQNATETSDSGTKYRTHRSFSLF
ncbi:uncharacterized protein LOC116159481 isoform X3 [Photinus pyralis]|nr:uncharacterized protein LOC116159481 isoform X3 [Photinus pyralis]XP_031328321.1 uncharacterized protein LOC116159481 isoform X3 [Photinus pyralis]